MEESVHLSGVSPNCPVELDRITSYHIRMRPKIASDVESGHVKNIYSNDGNDSTLGLRSKILNVPLRSVSEIGPDLPSRMEFIAQGGGGLAAAAAAQRAQFRALDEQMLPQAGRKYMFDSRRGYYEVPEPVNNSSIFSNCACPCVP